jgi:hypothetical protein
MGGQTRVLTGEVDNYQALPFGGIALAKLATSLVDRSGEIGGRVQSELPSSSTDREARTSSSKGSSNLFTVRGKWLKYLGRPHETNHASPIRIPKDFGTYQSDGLPGSRRCLQQKQGIQGLPPKAAKKKEAD